MSLVQSAVILIELLIALFIADLITGFIHWWEDAYGDPNWPIIGKYIVEPNLVHHQLPRDLCPAGYWKLTHISWVFAVILIGVPWLAFDWHPLIWVASMIIAVQANQVHCWAHRTDKENSATVRFFQRTGVIQSRRHHGLHHRPPFINQYCILTDYLNPVLNYLHFWDSIEWMLLKIFRIPVLRGAPVRNGL